MTEINGRSCTLSEILDYISGRPLLIPSIQRNYKWESGNITKQHRGQAGE